MTSSDALPAFDRRMFLGALSLAASAVLLPRPAAAQDANAPAGAAPAAPAPGGPEAAEVVEGASGQHQIEISGMAFQTPELKIKVGETVTWTNKDDGIAPNVHFRQGPMKGSPKSRGPMLNTGKSYTLKFNQAGEYAYICTPHPMMKAKLVVEG